MNVMKKLLEKLLDAEIDGATTAIMYHPALPRELREYERKTQKSDKKTCNK